MAFLGKPGFAQLLGLDLLKVYGDDFQVENKIIRNIIKARDQQLDEMAAQAFKGAMGIVKKPQTWVLVGPVTCIHESARAICVRIRHDDGRWRDYWLPKSSINKEETEVTKSGDEGIMVIAEWIAKEKGLA